MSRKNGGIIGPANTPVGGLITGLAGGVWRMNDVANFVGNSQWPKTPENIDNSCLFDGSGYGQRSISTAGSGTTATFSAWVKTSALPDKALFTSYIDSNNYVEIYFNSGQFRVYHYDGGSTSNDVQTNAYFRDQSAWYNFHVIFDTTNGTEADRIQMYVNGTRVTSFATSTYPTSSQDLELSSTSVTFNLGARNGDEQWNGYMAEVVFIDGQALTPSSFGETDSTTGIWKPKKIGQIANAGTNSFYLDFKDSSNLGNDASGLNNDFTVSGLASTDQMTDTCVENFVTMNSLNPYQYNFTFSEGNLKLTNTDNQWHAASGTIGISKGKWYYEAKYTGSSNLQHWYVGFGGEAQNATDATRNNVAFYNNDGGEIHTSNVGSSTATTADYGTFSQNDIIGIALDYDNENISVYKNGSAIVTNYNYGALSQSSELKDGKTIFPYVAHYASGDITLNFGNPPYSISSGNSDANGFGNFEYSVPSGYYALNTSNLNTYG